MPTSFWTAEYYVEIKRTIGHDYYFICTISTIPYIRVYFQLLPMPMPMPCISIQQYNYTTIQYIVVSIQFGSVRFDSIRFRHGMRSEGQKLHTCLWHSINWCFSFVFVIKQKRKTCIHYSIDHDCEMCDGFYFIYDRDFFHYLLLIL